MPGTPTGLGWPSLEPAGGPAGATGRQTGLGWPSRVVSRETPELRSGDGLPLPSAPIGESLPDGPPNLPVPGGGAEQLGDPVAIQAAADIAVAPEASEPKSSDGHNCGGDTIGGPAVKGPLTLAAPSKDEPSGVPASDRAPVSRETPRGGLGHCRLPRPGHLRVLAIANQKGGVGKTTSTVNIAAALALHGLRVLVIDLDPQGNASTALGIDHQQDIPSVYDALLGARNLAEVIQPVEVLPGLLCAPATIDLAGAEIELVPLVARELRLRRALRAYLDQREARKEATLDYVLVDCPPSLGLLTVNALVAAGEILIPIQCEYYALEGLGQLLRSVELVRGYLNPDLYVSTVLLTMYDGRTRLAAQVADEVRAHFPETVLQASIPRSVRISEAPSYGQTIMTYDPSSSGALSYLEAAREVANRGAVAARTVG